MGSPFQSSQLLKGQLVKTEAVAAELALELQWKSQVTNFGARLTGGFDRFDLVKVGMENWGEATGAG